MSLSPTLAHYSSFLQPPPHPLFLHSFPTRRSSDLSSWLQRLPRTIPASRRVPSLLRKAPRSAETRRTRSPDAYLDRKSTRLNSSHVSISYAVFCLKKKKNLV